MKSIPKGMGAEDFNIYFKNVPDVITSSFTDDSSLLWKGQKSLYTIKFNDIQRADLLQLFISLSDKTGIDILGFDRKLIKIAGHHMADSLLYIINDCLSNGIFPEDLKLARVTPVFQNNGDVDVMSNYRPISVIGHIAKMVEQLVRSQLVSYLEEHSFITPDQSVYLNGHSTQTSLHRVIEDWLENIKENQITGVCLLDISKCFDTISHSILLQKLSMYWIKQQELKWFSSYLDRRKQAVLCHNELSSFVDVTCVLPQGSLLGPFLPEASFGLRVLSSPASVGLCVRVCVCINHELVRTITHRSFKLGSPNLDQRCKTPWFRSLLFLGMIDLDLQGQI